MTFEPYVLTHCSVSNRSLLPLGTSPLIGFMNTPPLGIMSFLLKAASFGSGLLGHIQGAGVDDIAPLAHPECGVDQLLILLTPSPVSARERLATPHNHLEAQGSHNSLV